MWLEQVRGWARGGLFESAPTFSRAIWPALAVSVVLFVRIPSSNYIFDEQEALLGNPYLNTPGISFWSAFERDFWGLPPSGTIGSYRPLPNLAWRLLWSIAEQPWLLHWLNVILHAVNGALLTSYVGAVTRSRPLPWLVGASFLTCAMLTEAVTGVVGLADVLAGTGVLLALHATRLPWYLAFPSVFLATAVGLGAKESAMVLVPLIFWATLVLAPRLFPARPRRWARALLLGASSAAAFIGYTYFRRAVFPSEVPAALRLPLAPDASVLERILRAFLLWFRQPQLPHDPLNNPLLEADFAHRLSGALSVYGRSLTQLLFPWRLSGDYSFAEERIPETVISLEAAFGALLMVGPPLVAIALWTQDLMRERRQRCLVPSRNGDGGRDRLLLALALAWFPIAYFPHSNIPVLLPTVRAERLWYLPAMGTAMLLGYLLCRLLRHHGRVGRVWPLAVLLGFLGFQALQARVHALAYTSDLAFWRATVVASPRSAKAQLNYAVMVGARGRMQERLVFTHRALRLAPEWPMASVYFADALCRSGRPAAAWRHYLRGFELGPNQKSLIALGLQCLWDTGMIPKRDEALRELAAKHPGSWLSYLVLEVLERGAQHGGVPPEHRPRGYDQKRSDSSSSIDGRADETRT